MALLSSRRGGAAEARRDRWIAASGRFAVPEYLTEGSDESSDDGNGGASFDASSTSRKYGEPRSNVTALFCCSTPSFGNDGKGEPPLLLDRLGDASAMVVMDWVRARKSSRIHSSMAE